MDRVLRIIMKSPNVPFEGKCVLFSEHFRQMLSLVPRNSRSVIVLMCFQYSPLHLCTDCLSQNEDMRLQAIPDDQESDTAVLEYPNFLLKVGEEKLKQAVDSLIELPPSINIVDSSTKLVKYVFSNLKKKIKMFRG